MREIITETRPDTSAIEAAECPSIPTTFTERERAKVLGVCLVRETCKGPVRAPSGFLRCCKGARDAIEMTVKADDIIRDNNLAAKRRAEAERFAAQMTARHQQASVSEPVHQLDGYLRQY